MNNKYYAYLFFVLVFFHFFNENIKPQPGPSFSASYDFFSYSNLADPDPNTFLKTLEIRVATLKLKASYPMFLSQETFLNHELLYDRFDMDYKNWNKFEGGNEIPHGHSIKYNLVIMNKFSDKWSLLAVLTPGLASDFRSKLSKDDLTIEAAVVFIHQLSKRFSLGGGLAYSRQFGKPYPLPVLALDWNNGTNLKAEAIIPASIEFWYLISSNVELGLVFTGDGNEYHGAPARYGGTNPKMSYSVLNFGPSLSYRLSKIFSLSIDGGYTFLRRFEFTNEMSGNYIKQTLDLENDSYVRIGLKFGG